MAPERLHGDARRDPVTAQELPHLGAPVRPSRTIGDRSGPVAGECARAVFALDSGSLVAAPARGSLAPAAPAAPTASRGRGRFRPDDARNGV